jgi:hypothetical protein
MSTGALTWWGRCKLNSVNPQLARGCHDWFSQTLTLEHHNQSRFQNVPFNNATCAATPRFSGSAFAILLRNIEGSIMIQAPVINEQVEFAGALGLICAFRGAVAFAKPGVEKSA